MPRSVLHLLLSLLLLVSQQMALAHGLSHWSGVQRQAPVLQGGDQPDAPALHEFCAECAADAQLDVALPLPEYGMRPAVCIRTVHPAQGSEGVRPRTIGSFQPRGPPRAI